VPRFSRTVAATPRPPSAPGEHAEAILAELGYAEDAVAALRGSGAVRE
jgi:crotonobetainyl-CoA:carnitine CoA-transferase CaiB-like acyl-CoA transferase